MFCHFIYSIGCFESTTLVFQKLRAYLIKEVWCTLERVWNWTEKIGWDKEITRRRKAESDWTAAEISIRGATIEKVEWWTFI